MKKQYLHWKIILLFFLFASCNASVIDEKLIVGSWSGAEWLVEGKPSNMNATDTHFNFDDKGKYTYDYAGTKETGTYKIENDMLFTKPGDQQEMMVKITRLTKDSLIFEMNRGGIPETLVLLKK